VEEILALEGEEWPHGRDFTGYAPKKRQKKTGLNKLQGRSN